MNQATLPEEIANRIEALETAKAWESLAAYIDTLSPSRRDLLLPTYIKALQGAGQFERMLAVCREKISLLDGPGGPRLSVARIGQAQALSKLGRHPEAAQAHLQNGRLGLPLGWSNGLAELRATEDFPALLAAGEELLRLQPNHPQGLIYRGEALTKLGRYAEAEPALSAALQLNPQAAMAWADVACCRVQRGAFLEAIEAADQALSLDPHHVEALYNRGRARFGLSQYREGKTDFASALATGTADPSLRAALLRAVDQADRYLAYQEKHPKKAPRPGL